MATRLTLFELTRVSGGRIIQTHQNWCLALDGGPCICTTVKFREVHSHPTWKAWVT